MPTKKQKNSQQERWLGIEGFLQLNLPHLWVFLVDEAAFSELRVKARDDGTTLSIAKGYGSDGGPVVAFGVGYGIVPALMALDATIQGDNWRVDKPWKPANDVT